MTECERCIELNRKLEQCERELAIVRRQLSQYQSTQMASYAEKRRLALEQYKLEYEKEHNHSLPLEPTQVPMDWEDVID